MIDWKQGKVSPFSSLLKVKKMKILLALIVLCLISTLVCHIEFFGFSVVSVIALGFTITVVLMFLDIIFSVWKHTKTF